MPKTTPEMTPGTTPESAVPESKVQVPVAAQREVLPALRGLADTASMLAAQPRTSDIIRDVAETFLRDVDKVQDLLHLAAEMLNGQKRQDSDTVICGREMVDRCYRTIAAYRACVDAEKQLELLDDLRLQYAGLGTWLTTSGSVVKDVITGEERKRSDSERDTIRIAKRVASVAPRLVPFHLSTDNRAKVNAFRAERLAKRASNATRKTVDASTPTPAIAPAIAPAQ